jgi:hypothetical protein
MTMLNTITQSSGDYSTQNSASGNLIQNYYAQPVEMSLGSIKRLLEAYREEKANPSSNEMTTYISKLEHFSTNPDGDILTLEDKLIKGNWESDYEYALEAKEMYRMLLHKNKFSKSIQHIHAFLLARVLVSFNSYVLTEIRKENSSKASVKAVLYEKVIVPIDKLIRDDVSVHDDDIEIFSDDIDGMIYFLTGNCHLKWI